MRSVPGHWQGRDDCVLDATRQGCLEARLEEGGRGDAFSGDLEQPSQAGMHSSTLVSDKVFG